MQADYAQLREPDALLRQLTLAEKVQLLAGADLWRTAAVPRLGVPYLKVCRRGRACVASLSRARR